MNLLTGKRSKIKRVLTSAEKQARAAVKVAMKNAKIADRKVKDAKIQQQKQKNKQQKWKKIEGS